MKLASLFGTTFASLRVRNYRLFFSAQAISLSGNWMQIIAQTWLVLNITNSGSAVGWLMAVTFIPFLIFSPWGGLLADRLVTRRLLIYTNIISAILALVLGVIVYTGATQLWMIYLLAFLNGIANAVDTPARKVFVMEMVGPKRLSNAVSLNSTLFNLGRVVGPAAGGVIIAFLGITTCFFINTASFLATICALALMKEQELHKPTIVSKSKGQLLEGIRYVFRTPSIRFIIITIFVIGTLTIEYQVVLPLLAKFTFKSGVGTFALFMSVLSIGSLIGGLYAASRKQTVGLTNVITAAFGLGASVLVVALMPTVLSATMALFVAGIFFVLYTTSAQTILQLNSAPEMRGRVMALWTVGLLGTTPIGGPIVGYISQQLSPRWGVAIGGLAALLIGIYGLTKLKKLHSFTQG